MQELIHLGRYAEAEKEARAHLAGTERLNGPDSLETARALDLLSGSILRAGNWWRPDALEIAERAVAIKERRLGTEDPEFAESLVRLADVLYQRDEDARALALYERALAIVEKALGPQNRAAVEPLLGISDVQFGASKYEQAVELAQRAMAILVKAGMADDRLMGSALNRVAGPLSYLGQGERAIEHYQRSLRILEGALGPEHPMVGRALFHLGTSYRADLGDYAAAEQALRRALQIQEKALGPDHPEVASTRENYGIVLWHMGDQMEARPYFEKALALREKIMGPGHVTVAWNRNSLGLFLLHLGDFAAARSHLESALASFQKQEPWDPDTEAGALNNLAMVLQGLGEIKEARRLLEKAVAIFETSDHPDTADHARVRNTLATFLRDTGDPQGAKLHFRKALAIWEKIGASDHPDASLDLTNLGELLLDERDVAGARPLLERALAIRERAVGQEHPDVAVSLNNMAKLEWAEGKAETAVELALRAERIGREHFRLTAHGLAEREALKYAAVRPAGLDVALSVIASAPGAEQPSRVWDELIRSRALVLDEMAERHRASTASGGGKLDTAAGRLEAARKRIAQLVVLGPGGGNEERHGARLRQAQEEKERAERAVAEQSTAFRRSLARQRVGFEQVFAALPESSALVAYVQYRRSGRPAGTAGPSAVPEYLAWVLRRGDAQPRAVPLGPAREIDALVLRWKEKASVLPQGLAASGGREEEAYRRAAEPLRRAVWDPLAPYLKGVARVFVVPDGSLHLVSLATLPAAEGRYLVEVGPTLHYLSAERDLVRGERHDRPAGGLLAVGGPDYDVGLEEVRVAEGRREHASASAVPPVATLGSAPGSSALGRAALYRGATTGCTEFRTMKFKPIPGSWLEASELQDLWAGRARPVGGAASEVTILTGRRAGEGAFKREAGRQRVLHLATHGFFLQEDCTTSSDNPLLLSGLALAGANRRMEAGGRPDLEDGILTAEEIASLDLSKVEWTVLSACETGLGRVHSGEGVLGLRRAFEVAGAGTLILSLWSVEDEATRDWMRTLYRERQSGASTVDAVRRAALGVIEARRRGGHSTHPFFWGAFVAAGDWR